MTYFLTGIFLHLLNPSGFSSPAVALRKATRQVFGQVFGQVFDQMFGQGFDQGFGGGEKTINTMYSTTRPKENPLKTIRQRQNTSKAITPLTP